MEKMNRMAKGLDVFFKVLFWLAVIGSTVVSAALIIGIIMLAVNPEIIIKNFTPTTLTLGYTSFELAESCPIDPEYLLKAYIALLIQLIAGSVLACYGIKVIRKFLEPMKKSRPFSKDTSKSLSKLGWLTIVLGTVYQIMVYANQFLMLSVFDFETLSEKMADSGIVHCTITTQINAMYIVVALFMFLLSYVFKYGEKLQEQDDETL